MFSDLRDLYQEVILDHYKRPRNFGLLEAANREAEGHNPLCGDQVTIYLQVEDGIVKDIRFQGAGCAISTASASLMTDALKGKSVQEVDALFERFHRLVTDSSAEAGPELGKLAILAGVREYPVRVKCATLAWHTLQAALRGSGTVTTE
ncbi:Fe-S cluster assembly sulfur transfer protein SufU [Gloeobacter morelensis]|uniref:SUF system NifU family Fe-S cluster assembly protein n=1 Tax=Gloeobacter morelensis MG652769 TaxID=2781736 RepID=A0ABY3PIG9_9CYAN|nr:SUF system NifU family Fe-S cluster assembly protein [Gloeobacter morelensis]UFP93457.1 SUF system NifU family Fe-S cluster assembly protein [Gloeobacter morelensis MG652769]